MCRKYFDFIHSPSFLPLLLPGTYQCISLANACPLDQLLLLLVEPETNHCWPHVQGYGGHPLGRGPYPQSKVTLWQQPSTVNNSSARGGTLAASSPPSMLELLLVWSLIGNHNCYEFMQGTTMPCPEDSFPPHPLGLTVFLPTSPWCFLNLGEAEVDTWLFNGWTLTVADSQYFHQSVISFCSNCKKEDSLINEENSINPWLYNIYILGKWADNITI